MSLTDHHSEANLHHDAAQRVPMGLRVSAAWAWRIIVVGVVLVAFVTAFSNLAPILLPMIIALLICAPLERMVTRLQTWGIPRSGGAAITILTLLGVVIGLSIASGAAILNSAGQLRDRAIAGFEELVDWLATGPLNLGREQLDGGISEITDTVRGNAWGLASGALSVTGAVGGLVAGVVIALIAMFFFLRDGRIIWKWFVGFMPKDGTQERVDRAGQRAWRTLQRYTQTSVFVAFVDAVGIGMVAWALGVPLALPIAVLTFLTAFIPLFGATIAGLVAVLIALVDGGWTTALLMLAGIIVVQQIEGNVLYPWLFGKAASIHPFAILLTISAGTLTAGLVGALLAVPILAFTYTFGKALKDDSYVEDDDLPITSQIPILAKKSTRAVKAAFTRTGDIKVRKRKK